MKYYRLLPALALTMFVAYSCSRANEEGENRDESVGMEAEYVEKAAFTDLEGNEVALSDFKGKVVMIDFWETWCKPCLASFPTMQKAVEEYPQKFVVLAVTPGFMDKKEDARQFISDHDYEFMWLWDEHKLHQKLGVQGIPFKIYVDADGNFIKSKMGITGDDKQDFQELASVIEEHMTSSREAAKAGNRNE